MTTQKFSIGDTIKFKTKYGELKSGKITESGDCLQKLGIDGSIDPGGLMISTTDIKDIQLNYRYDEILKTLEIDHPATDYGTFILEARTDRYGWVGYGYTVACSDCSYRITEDKIIITQ